MPWADTAEGYMEVTGVTETGVTVGMPYLLPLVSHITDTGDILVVVTEGVYIIWDSVLVAMAVLVVMVVLGMGLVVDMGTEESPLDLFIK